MSLFVDTSAILALLDGDEPRHGEIAAAWNEAAAAERPLSTSNYIVVESFALAQRRMGFEAVRAIADRFLPLIETLFVSADIHASAAAAFLIAGRRQLSFVDCVSFELMRRHGIREALSLDPDFERQGFRLLP